MESIQPLSARIGHLKCHRVMFQFAVTQTSSTRFLTAIVVVLHRTAESLIKNEDSCIIQLKKRGHWDVMLYNGYCHAVLCNGH